MPPAQKRSARLTFVTVAAAMVATACVDTPFVAPALPEAHASVAASSVTAVGIGNIIGYAVNDLGAIVGPSDGSRSNAYIWDAIFGLKLLATGAIAWDVSNDGLTVGGKNAAGKAVVWTSGSVGGARTETVLPDAGNGGAVRSIASDAAGAPLIMTGNVFTNGSTKTPAKWTPCTTEPGCSNGWLLQPIALTQPLFESWGQDVNPSGMVVGMEGTGCCRAAFWDADGTQTILMPLVSGAAAAAWGINDAGTVIVGQSNGIAVMWTRPSTSTPFAAPTRLETTACKGTATSIAYAVNPDLAMSGVIVGQACGNPVAWKVDLTAPASIMRINLPSTGRSASGLAQSINRSTSGVYRIAGQVNGAGAYWTGF
jgi:uncharacterized membrane protein